MNGTLMFFEERTFLEQEHHNLPLVVSFWQFMTTQCSEFSLYSWIFWVTLVAAYIAGGFFWVVMDMTGLCKQYKIQNRKKARQ